jgi:ribonuclease Z
MGTIEAHFLTHLHSDHVVGLPDLWLTGWLRPDYGGRKTPFVLYGPPGTKAMMDHLEKAFDWDIQARLVDEKNPPDGIKTETHDIPPGVVFDRDGLKVTAFVVDHGEVLKPAYGYTITFRGRKVVLSGDTRKLDAIAEQAKGADLLIHEVAAIRPELLKTSDAYQRIFAHHVSPAEAGEIFALARPKLAVFSHIALYGSAKIPVPTEEEIIKETRSTYAGPLVMGRDLMTFEIGDEVKIEQPAK